MAADESGVRRVARADGRYFSVSSDADSAVLLAGPYQLSDDGVSTSNCWSVSAETSAIAAARDAAQAVGQALLGQRQRLELATQLEVVSHAVLAVTGELSLDTVLRRLVDLARELAGASYAALGVPGPRGDLVAFLTSGMTDDQERTIGDRPVGRGVLGLLLREPTTIRLPT